MNDVQARELAAAFDPEALGREFYEDPYPTYCALREFDPVHRCPDGSFFLTRYAHLDRIYRDRDNYSSDKKAAFGPKFGIGTPLYQHHTTSLVFNDAPYHTRVRRSIVSALSPSVLLALAPRISGLVDGLLDRIEGLQRFDLIADYAAAIPVEVIGNLLGLPHEDRGSLRHWSLAILGALEPRLTAGQQAAGDAAVRDFSVYLDAHIRERRRRSPGDTDLLDRLLQERQLSEAELIQNCIFLLNAGHETTTNLIGNGLHLLLSTGCLTRLREQPQLIGSTVEECLRYESSNQLGNRLVVRPVNLEGVELAPGAYLTLCIGAANRDPAAFNEPERFDMTRNPNRHLAFGAGGHACAGMSVARLEAQIAILKMAQRFPELRLDGAAERAGRARFRGFRSLPAVTGAGTFRPG